MDRYIKYFGQLLKTHIYASGCLIYFFIETWNDSTKTLTRFRENKLYSYEKDKITDEWTAVEYGAKNESPERLVYSLFWPIKVFNTIISFMILQVNTCSIKKK